MYFGGLDSVGDNSTVLWVIGVVFLAVLLASSIKKTKEKAGAVGAEQVNATVTN